MIKIFRRIAAIWPMMKDREQALWKKILVAGSVVYLISPIEFVPDFFLPVGLLDDLVLWGCILTLLGDTLDSYASAGKKRRGFVNYKKKFKGSEVIDNVDFEVTEDSESEKDNTGGNQNG